MKPNEILQISKSLRIVGKPIAFYPEIAKKIGSINATIFLCQFLYWEGKQECKERWIYKSQIEIYNETGLSRRKQENVRSTLKKLGILEEELKGSPPLVHFKFNWEILDKILSDETVNFDEPDEQAETTDEEVVSQVDTMYQNNTVSQNETKYSEIIGKWNDFARKNNLQTISKLTDKRRRKINARLKEKDFDLDRLFELIPKSKFLLGSKGWKVNFDWLLKNNENYIQILEGGYGIKDSAEKKKYTYQEVLEITGGQIRGKFYKSEDGFWYKL